MNLCPNCQTPLESMWFYSNNGSGPSSDLNSQPQGRTDPTVDSRSSVFTSGRWQSVVSGPL